MPPPAPDTDRVLALIPARGGSKRLPRKNVLPLAGRPLIAWTIQAALEVGGIDDVVVSTDDPEIAEVSRAAGALVPFRRPPALASDEATTLDVVWHALAELGDRHDWLVLLQPTSPLRTAADIAGALDLARRRNAPVTSIACPGKPLGWVHRVEDSLIPIGDEMDSSPIASPRMRAAAHGAEAKVPRPARRARAPGDDRYRSAPAGMRPLAAGETTAAWGWLNGALYVVPVAWLRHSGAFVTDATLPFAMPVARSVDIDTAEDFALAEALCRLA